MRFFLPRPIQFALCVVIALSGALIAIEECGFDNGVFRCTYPAATYHVRLPERRSSQGPIPVVVVLHDAGQSGIDIVSNEALIGKLLRAGFAVIAPNAVPRENRSITYLGDRPGLVEGQEDNIFDATYWERRFLIQEAGGTVRTLKFGRDRGWYYYNIDRMRYGFGTLADRTTDYIGRDEIQALRDVLEHSAREHGTSERPALILGFGHGGSLVWQIACQAPGLANLLAPVGGAFWGWLPDRCEPGAWLLHTHERASRFWPLSGSPGSKRRYQRTSIHENIDLLLRDNWCSGAPNTGRRSGSRASLTTWDNCVDGGPVELLVLDGRFAFQDWWMEELLSRIGPVQDEAVPEPMEPDTGKPVFKKPGSDPDSPFKRPRAPG